MRPTSISINFVVITKYRISHTLKLFSLFLNLFQISKDIISINFFFYISNGQKLVYGATSSRNYYCASCWPLVWTSWPGIKEIVTNSMSWVVFLVLGLLGSHLPENKNSMKVGMKCERYEKEIEPRGVG